MNRHAANPFGHVLVLLLYSRKILCNLCSISTRLSYFIFNQRNVMYKYIYIVYHTFKRARPAQSIYAFITRQLWRKVPNDSDCTFDRLAISIRLDLTMLAAISWMLFSFHTMHHELWSFRFEHQCSFTLLHSF